MKITKRWALTTVASLSFLTGCAGYTPKYYDINSLAHNAATAGGVYGVKDRTVPKADLGNFTQSVEYGALYTAAGMSGTALGLSSLGGGLFHMVDALIDEGPDAERVSMFAWMPESYAANKAEAKQKMFALMNDAIRETLTAHELEFTPFATDNPDVVGYYIHSEKYGCPAMVDIEPNNLHQTVPFKPVRTEACVIRAAIKNPPARNTPSDIRMAGHTEASSYLFAGSTSRQEMNAIHVQRGQVSSLPENALYMDISSALPSWAFIHLGPGRVSLSPEHTVPFPYLLNKGKPYFYVRPN